MKTNTITLYEIEGLNRSKNFKVEDIVSFLETEKISELVVSDFQYQKIELDMSLCFKMNQIDFNDMDELFPFNYLTIEDSDDSATYESRVYCFFITGYRWASDKSLTLDVHLDVLNSFNSQLYNYSTGEENPVNDYVINTKHSRLYRSFKDRFAINTYTFHHTCEHEEFVYSGSYRAEVTIFSYAPFTNIQTQAYNTHEDTEELTPVITSDGHGYYCKLIYTDTQAFEDDFYVEVSYNSKRLLCNIDMISEGLTPQKYKTKEEFITDDDLASWYLLYKNKDDISDNEKTPFNCFLVSDTQYQAYYPDSPTPITASNLELDVLYSLSPYSLGHAEVGYVNDNLYYGSSYPSDVENAPISYVRQTLGEDHYLDTIRGIFFKKNGTKIDVWVCFEMRQYNSNTLALEDYENHLIKKVQVDGIYWAKSETITTYKNMGTWSRQASFTDFVVSQDFNMSTAYLYHNLKTIDEIDKTDSRVIKLIALPYKPLELDINGDIIYTNNSIEYDSTEELIKITNYNEVLRYQFKGFDYKFVNKFFAPVKIQTNGYPSLYSNAYLVEDPKLLHSDFETHKIVYDTFSFDMALEEYNTLRMYGSNSDIYEGAIYNILKSKNVNSNFIVTFDIPQRYSHVDYDNVLIVNRNNEMTLFSNQYLNYLRTGYNFDVKAKNRAQIGAVLSAGNSILGTMGSLATGNPLGAIYSTSNMINSVMGAMQAEDSLNAKVKSAQYQATNILNNDDVDILKEYSSNKLKYVEYEAEPQMRESINELFRLYGYACVGTFNSNSLAYKTRECFDYIQADIKIDYTRQMKQEWIDEIVDKYKEGITIFHKIKGHNFWDISQTLQNWEISLYIPEPI